MSKPPFAELVREKMKERGLGLREVCRAAGLDPSFLSKVLAGKRSPPWEEGALRRLAAALEFDAPRLIVSAGRIPSEWSRLWSDGDLFRSVDSLAAGARPAPPTARPASAAPAPSAPPRTRERAPAFSPRSRALEEELL